jgi:hypothetical protein
MANVRNPIDMHSATMESILDHHARGVAGHIFDKIRAYDATLDKAHEVGVRIVSFGQTVIFHLEDVECTDPSLICFTGKTGDGDPVELIQHVSQISIRRSRRNPLYFVLR